MEHRELGKTGMQVSVVGIGTLGFARAGLCKDDEASRKAMVDIVSRALELGVTFIDTALAYGGGRAEQAVGAALKASVAKPVILTRTHSWQKSSDPAVIAADIDASRERLGVDVLDVYEIHDVSSPKAYQKVRENKLYEPIVQAKKEGKVKAIGYSSHGDAELIQKIVDENEIDVVTLAYNILHSKRSPGDGEDPKITATKLFPMLKERGIGITVMKPFGGGILTWNLGQGTALPPARLVRYVVENPHVATVTPGADTLAQLEEWIPAGNADAALSPADIQKLEEAANNWGANLCRQCGYCRPCSQEIDIPKVMRLLMQWQHTKDEKLREQYAKLDVKANACVECGDCEERCPYDLAIAEKMKETAAIFE
ncbi:MAG: aldo/keto reductase [Kiritimatiellae bacterium]|nr:aldo/keto reductase [Kiritimatiellia bacterium]